MSITVTLRNGVDKTSLSTSSSQDLVFSYVSKDGQQTMLMRRDVLTGSYSPIPDSIRVHRPVFNYQQHYDCVLRNYETGLVHAYSRSIEEDPVNYGVVQEYTYDLDTDTFNVVGDFTATVNGKLIHQLDAGVGLPNGDILFGALAVKNGPIVTDGLTHITDKIWKLNTDTNTLVEVTDLSDLDVMISDLNLFSDGSVAVISNDYPDERVFKGNSNFTSFNLVFTNNKWSNSGFLFNQGQIVVYANDDEILTYDEAGTLLSTVANPDFGAAYDGMASVNMGLPIQQVTVLRDDDSISNQTVFDANGDIYLPNDPAYSGETAELSLE